jgi:N-methylhydantoinase A/oxoprolinase/acetone carboxylase beta subunit
LKKQYEEWGMTVALGIDTGGTYTDAVLVNSRTGEILSKAKSLTTKHDLSIGIKQAILSVLKDEQKPVSADTVSLVALSTTLATNAIAEGHGVPVCLLLIGYDPELIQRYKFQHELAADDIVYLNGGHDIRGNEVSTLDEHAAKHAIDQRLNHVSAFAVSGFFGALNPIHELKIRQLINDMSDLPVTCGHELSTRFNSIKRATTAALNARLIPIIQDLIANVRSSLAKLSITAPLMVVKGDGSLVRAEWAMKRPIETVLSGPASSAIGAFQLAGNKDFWAVDVGGTTTDIVELLQGKPKLNPEGANIGGWRTMVEAVDVHTLGLGGDSHIRRSSEQKLQIGPKRVVPLCKLASEYPEILRDLQRQVKIKRFKDDAGQFLILGRKPHHQLSEKDKSVLNRLNDSPQSMKKLVDKTFRVDPWISRRIQYLEEIGLVQRAAFTPTDALHVINRFQRWNSEASKLGAELLAHQFGLAVIDFCKKAILAVSKQLAAAVITKAIEDEGGAAQWEKEPTAKVLLERALDDVQEKQLGCKVMLRRPIVALGAPVEAYMPAAADKLHTELIVPSHAEVANAIGAVSGGVIQRFRMYIRPMDAGLTFRLHLPDGSKDFSELEQAVGYAHEYMVPHAKEQARQAGAEQVEIKIDRTDKRAKVRGHQDVYLGTQLIYTAFGRPSFKFNL